MSPQSMSFSTGSESLKLDGGSAGAATVVVLLVVVVVVVLRVVEGVEASGTYCPGGGFDVADPELPSAGVLGGLAHSGCKTFQVLSEKTFC